MYKLLLITIALILTTFSSCNGQTFKNKNMSKNTTNNPLLCDPEEGFCGIPEQTGDINVAVQKIDKPLKVIYFTDPICSSCWGIEPQLRKLKLEYGKTIEIEYRMGGLLPDWNYNSGGISKPADVAHHWDEVSVYYDMPIDGDVWLEDPLNSSYPSSIAFKAAQIQDEDKAVVFLRVIREMVFLEKKNITKWEHLSDAALQVGLDIQRFKTDYEGAAKTLFQEDLAIARQFSVRGFPTLFFVDNSGNTETVYGSKPYTFYETAILKLYPNVEKEDYSKNMKFLFSKYNSLTAKEFSELSGISRIESEKFLNELSQNNVLKKKTIKNGAIWSLE